MKDRIPLYPGRVTLTPVSGQANTYDMTRADQPTEEGDPLNKNTLLKDATAQSYGGGATMVPDDVLAMLAGSLQVKQTQKTIADLEPGTVFQLDELGDGNLVNFVKLQNDYESSGRVLVRRASVLDQTTIFSSNYYGPYTNSELDTLLNETYYGTLSAELKSLIQDVTIPIYSVGTLQRKVFAPSITETGFQTQSGDGTAIPGVSWPSAPNNYWTRSGYSGSGSYACSITASGTSWSQSTRDNNYYALPMFTLPSDFQIDGQYTYTLQTPTGDNVTDEVAQALGSVKVETGSYVGTETYGQSNPSSLTFSAPPILVWFFATKNTNNGYWGTPNLGSYASRASLCTVPMWSLGTDFAVGPPHIASGTGSTGISDGYSKKSQDGKTLSWYNKSGTVYQLNSNVYEYFYIALIPAGGES